MIRSPYCARWSIAQSMAAITLLVRPEPSARNTFRLTRFAPGATPRNPSPAPPMIPATCVPCPYWSCPPPWEPVKSTVASTRPCRAL